ncbi:MAG: alpha-amylase [Chloroflexi bacterium]|nr:alpha-amylase [Chloroflexota bacterium]
MEFHISRAARDRYQVDETLFSLHGNVVFANFHAARILAQRINDKHDLLRFPEQTVRAGQINAMGLIDEIDHFIVALYRQQKNPQLMPQALAWLDQKVGEKAVDEALRRFTHEFPPVAVYRREIAVDAYLAGESDGIPHRQIALEEMLLLWLANANPAFAPYRELFNDVSLEKDTAYHELIASLHDFLDTQPTFGPDDQNLVDMLREPAQAVPHSLAGQLEYIREKWGFLLGRYLYRLLGSLDLIKEEEKLGLRGPGPAQMYDFSGLDLAEERFSADRDWMPRLVLMAKNAYVWLDQLSKKYRRSITRLDQIPDEELDTLARWGFGGLWLIGLWERSPASQRIKQMCGNPQAVASAYSLFDYQVAADLGGEEAYQDLKNRAWSRGLRLATDMVPNHVGIYSRWVVEHPDWFVSLDYSPFPSYTFNGPDLSTDERVGIFLEDHYYTRSDAAVVFKRVDRWTGQEQYVYHGNDGTSMPWNDTAQLNYLKPEVREAVIQEILRVARKSPVIRFDAAMTLTRQHYQRLWFPEPGTGGAIPSRADHGLTKAQFNAEMPHEFWREVVDRVAEEAPDTLLLAEAFWLLEGYFVRTLGMHRVYNSAFMNMLRDEDNAKYRTVMKKTLEFDPEILKRFVNFMNNPDEETAVAQFGKGDKYFGISTMLVTLPGLPMFGHGQIEGFTEKYGMEYRRAFWDERPDEWLVQRHEREIFPLLHRRYLFADVANFLLYDFFTEAGTVNEDVFVYSNRAGEEHSLVVYHNRYASARGWVRNSVAYSAKEGPDGARRLIRKTLGDALGLHNDANYFCIFRDHRTGLEYLRNSKALWDKGLYVELGAYQCHVFLDFRETEDNAWHQYAHLAAYLNGRGVPSMEEALQEVFLQPVHYPFKELVNADLFRRLMEAKQTDPAGDFESRRALLDEVEGKVTTLLSEIKRFTNGEGDVQATTRDIRHQLEVTLQLPVLEDRFAQADLPAETLERFRSAAQYLQGRLDDSPATWGAMFGWLFVHSLGRVAGEAGFAQQSRSWIDEWLFGKIVAGVLRDLGLDEPASWRAVALIRLLTTHGMKPPAPARGEDEAGHAQIRPPEPSAYQVLAGWLQDGDGQQFLQVNRYQGVLWFNQECLEELIWWGFLQAVVTTLAGRRRPARDAAEEIVACFGVVERLQEATANSGYRVEEMLAAVR